MTDMDPGWFKIAVDIGQLVLTSCIGIWVYLETRDSARGKQITDLAKKIDQRLDEHTERIVTVEARPAGECSAHASRISMLEEATRHTPGHDDMKRAHSRIDNVAEGLAGLKGAISRMERTLDMISQHLLSGGKS